VTDGCLDPRFSRGLVLRILEAYQCPSDEHEKDIEQMLTLLVHSLPETREQAARVSRLWLGLKDRDPIRHRRLIYYRLRHLDNELSRLEALTRPKKAKCPK
jgi:hypothetical protein